MKKKTVSGNETVHILIYSIEELLITFIINILEYRKLTALLMRHPPTRPTIRMRKAGSRRPLFSVVQGAGSLGQYL